MLVERSSIVARPLSERPMSPRSQLALLLSAAALSFAPTFARAQEEQLVSARDEQPVRYSATQLENLVSPIALYPDALLAQVLVAATFPDQVEDAAKYVRANGTGDIDDQPWDVSVKSVAHYPSALNALADKLDWTTALGTAYANQSSDVMRAVQRLRSMAADQGNLVSNEQQRIVREQDNFVIVPAQPRVIFVPVYDPYVIYTRPVFAVGHYSRYWSFGIGFPIGSWLAYDCDWGTRVVYYNGWRDEYLRYGGGWRVRSRPLIHITNVYVSPRYRTVYVNRDVTRRVIDYRNVDRYPRVHRDTYFASDRDRRDGDRYDNDRRGDGRSYGTDGRDRGNNGGVTIERRAQPRATQPVGREAVTPDGYRRSAPPAGNANTPRGSAPEARIERLPRGDVGTPAPRVTPEPSSEPARPSATPRGRSERREFPQENVGAPRQETRQETRQESPRQESRTESRGLPREQQQQRQNPPSGGEARQQAPREAPPRQAAPTRSAVRRGEGGGR
jgi:hypothetical protein